MSKIGDFIRSFRQKRGLTQRELAELVGTSFSTLRRWEVYGVAPDVSDITKLAQALHVTEAELLNGPSEDTREIKLIFDKEGEFSMQMFNIVNMGAAASDQRFVCVSRDKFTTGFSLTTAGMDKDTARRMFMDEIDKAFEEAWTKQQAWKTERSADQKA